MDHGGVHYVGLFACYIKSSKVIINGKEEQTEEPEIVLLSVAPMSKIDATGKPDSDDCQGDEQVTEAASSFTAQVHVDHFTSIFRDYYNVAIGNWAKASIADNASTNCKVASLLDLPHVGCNNHKLNLDIKEWMKIDLNLKNAISGVATTMKEAKLSLKNAAILSELTPLKPILCNKTRWSGKFQVLDRFLRIRPALIEAANHEDSDLDVNASPPFCQRVQKYHKPMQKLNEITVKIQKRCCLLSECWSYLNYIVTRHHNNHDVNHVFYGNTFVPKRILWNGPLSPDKYFESGVVKIQTNHHVDDLTDDEKEAVHSLLRENNNVGVVNDEASDTASIDSLEELENYNKKRKQRQHNNDPKYVNCDFIQVRSRCCPCCVHPEDQALAVLHGYCSLEESQQLQSQ
jgi:hypothetical protein